MSGFTMVVCIVADMKFLILVTILSSALSTTVHAIPKNTQPNQLCAALIGGVGQWHVYQRQSEELTANVITSLRGFRLSLSMDSPQASVKKLNLSSHSASAKDLKHLRSELYGIEKLWYEPGDSLDKQNVIAAIELKGRAQIEEFYADVSKLADTAKSASDVQFMRLHKMKRAAHSIFGSLVMLGTSGLIVDGSYSLVGVSLSGLLMVLSEPVALARYMMRNDRTLEVQLKKIQKFLEHAQSGDWIFDSWSYEPQLDLSTKAWKGGVSHPDTKDALRVQDLQDSRGIIQNIQRPHYLKKNLSESEAESQIRGEQKNWAGFDQWVTFGQDGEPVLRLVLRIQNQRPEYPQMAPRSSVLPRLSLPRLVPELAH